MDSEASSDLHDLQRFVAAQANVYEQVLSELRAGQKQTHWMWFIFPQMKGLGSSPTAQRYAIQTLAEARAFLDHALLGPGSANALLSCSPSKGTGRWRSSAIPTT